MAEATATAVVHSQEVARIPSETSPSPREAMSRNATLETSRGGFNYQDAARTGARSAGRATLQPAVHDFNGNIINKAVDDDQIVWHVSKSHGKTLPAATEFAYPVPGPGTFRGSGAYGALYLPHVTNFSSATLGPINHNTNHHNGHHNGQPRNGPDRTAAWAEEVHRRHVARTARARQRLSPTKARGGGGGGGGVMVVERVTPSGGGASVMVEHRQDSTFSLTLPLNEDTLEDLRLTSISRLSSSRNDAYMTARTRPATTGRYFDSSNGLRNRFNGPAILRSRPNTASQFKGPGLNVRKSTLHKKELMT